jgi:Tfp pilus assembly protein PilF
MRRGIGETALTRRLILALALLVLIGPLHTYAQRRQGTEPTDIHVRIVFHDNRSVDMNLRVELLNARGLTVAEQFTHQGQVVFRVPISGDLHVRITGLGIEDTISSPFIVSQGEPNHFEMVEVRPRPGAEGEEKPERPGPMVSVLELNVPERAKSEFGKGNEGLQKQQWETAKAKFKKAIELYNKYPSAYNNLGVALMNLGDPVGARQAFERTIALDGSYLRAYVNLAKISHSERDYVHAEDLLNKAVSLDPNDPEALTSLAVAQLMMSKLADAISNARKVHQVPHDNFAVAHYVAAKALQASSRNDEAVVEYKLFVQEAPNNPNAQRALAAVEQLQKRP